MPRELTDRLRWLVGEAEREGLEDPVGRACYAVNRLLNGAQGGMHYMRTAKPETAARWREHYMRGGRLKALSRTEEQQRERARRQREKFLTEGERLRRAVRRIRREARKEARDGAAG